ncbi:hypothetical protein [Paenimyroides viscosum]|nr:hypothetical protein [Paenimyroides viscosum]
MKKYKSKLQMNLLFAARGKYDENNYEKFSWEKYKNWSKIFQLDELVSLDAMLNEDLVEPNYDNEEDWKSIHIVDLVQTGFYNNIDYVISKSSKKEKFNLLAVLVEPEYECSYIILEEYEFIGYDLLDQDFSISALTNCGGFDETFLPSELNNKGLLNSLDKSKDIQKRLFENNPEEHHADTNVIAVWRHLKIGREK